jgi:hypothetical protein
MAALGAEEAGRPPARVVAAASLRKSRRRGSICSLENLVDRVDGTFRTAIGSRHGEEAIQERVLRVGGLEAGVVRE